MKLIVNFILTILVAGSSVSCSSAELCPAPGKNGEWSSACFEGKGPARQLKPKYISRIIPNKAGFATIMIDRPRELVAVDQKGVVKIPNIVHSGDFDFPSAENGLGRFLITLGNGPAKVVSKCGYFDSATFQIVIPARYDECQAFNQGTAKVCQECKKYCTQPECQDSILVGGHGFIIDSKNTVLREFALPPLERACGDKQPGKLTKGAGAISYLQCTPAANSPFGQLR